MNIEYDIKRTFIKRMKKGHAAVLTTVWPNQNNDSYYTVNNLRIMSNIFGGVITSYLHRVF
jgi:hypothetical protein